MLLKKIHHLIKSEIKKFYNIVEKINKLSFEVENLKQENIKFKKDIEALQNIIIEKENIIHDMNKKFENQNKLFINDLALIVNAMKDLYTGYNSLISIVKNASNLSYYDNSDDEEEYH